VEGVLKLAMALGGLALVLLFVILVVTTVVAIFYGSAGSFSFDNWQEVMETLRRNKLRTALTALSVAWGIFILVFLLGMGAGLNQGVRAKFEREASNSLWFRSGKSSVPYAGFQIGRKVQFVNADIDAIKKLAGIDHMDARYYVKGGFWGGPPMMVRRGIKANAFDIQPSSENGMFLDLLTIEEGRFLNPQDLALKRKSVVIGRPVRDYLFEPGEDPVGQWINVGGVAFQVVGVFSRGGSQEEERSVYIPISTAQAAFSGADHVSMIRFTVGDARVDEANRIKDAAIAELSQRHLFAPDDPQALHIQNNVENFAHFAQLFTMIAMFVWVVGGGTIIAGVIGVSNIMMIAVRERTKEIGVRKALGATPFSIVAMIVQEGIFLTAAAGFFGLVGGVLGLELFDRWHPTDFINHPSINLSTGVAAGVVLVCAGALAGFFPARAAARVNPVHTLRDQ
jgi:putative ABC transport system permease protein